MKEIPQNVSESVRKLNPHLYANHLGRLQAHVPKPDSAPALVGRCKKLKKGEVRLEVVIGLHARRKALLDATDNLPSSYKPLIDAICKSIGVDDADKRIRFECSQSETRGQEGVIVTIQNL